MKQENIQAQAQTQMQQQQQVQSLTIQHVMAVRLTEMSLDALQQRVENECLENPWLEKEPAAENSQPVAETGQQTVDDIVADYRSEDDIPDYLLRTHNGDNAPENVEYGDTLSFYDQLKEQMGEYNLSEHEQQLMEYLIGWTSIRAFRRTKKRWSACSASCGSLTLPASEPARCRNVCSCRYSATRRIPCKG